MAKRGKNKHKGKPQQAAPAAQAGATVGDAPIIDEGDDVEEAEQVEQVAHLARLRLTPDELERMRAQLSSILDHIEMLQEVDISGVPTTAQVTDLTSATELMLEEPTLIKRPVVEHGDRIAVGFSETVYDNLFVNLSE